MEIWKDIEGFEGYQISSEGRVRSFWHRPLYGRGAKRVLSNDWHIVPQSDDGNGYLKVCLIKNGKNYSRKVHRLVAEAFIPNDDPSLTVDHIQSGAAGKLDNSVKNLQWLSRGDNIRKAWMDGACSSVVKRSSKPVEVQDIDSTYVMMFPSLNQACKTLGLNVDTARHQMSKYGDAHLSNFYNRFYIRYLEGKERAYIGEDWELGALYYDGWHY